MIGLMAHQNTLTIDAIIVLIPINGLINAQAY